METKCGERPNADASITSPQSEAVANELQELSLQLTPKLLPVRERKNGKWQFLHSNQIKLLLRNYAKTCLIKVFLKRLSGARRET